MQKRSLNWSVHVVGRYLQLYLEIYITLKVIYNLYNYYYSP